MMTDYPLLLFNKPKPSKYTPKKGSAQSNTIEKPDHKKQGERLDPQFEHIEKLFQNSSIQETSMGIDPGQVLVITTFGKVEKFINAVNKIGGFEWMGEIKKNFEPDEDFFHTNGNKKKLDGQLYMIMSNQKAFQKILSLWKEYKKDKNYEFERGVKKFRDVFAYLKSIRQWNIQDRIGETGLLEIWKEDLKNNANEEKQTKIQLEIELWFHKSEDKQKTAQRKIDQCIKDIEGKILTHCIIPDIAYHGLLAEIPTNAAQDIIDNLDTLDMDLIKWNGVMFFRPVSQMTTGKEPIEVERLDHESIKINIPSNELPTNEPPIVAVLDGLPLANHTLLANRLIIDDPENYESEYTIKERKHGTAMSSLIIYGDLSGKQSPLTRRIYVRPILKPAPTGFDSENFYEEIPQKILMIDLIHRAIRRIFEGEQNNEPVASTIKVINFSIGDQQRPFLGIMSPLSRLLDWLSFKYSVLIIISAGNHTHEINPRISKEEFDHLSKNEQEAQIVKALYSDRRHRKLLAPAESINALTVGALHNDHHDPASASSSNHVINLFENILPSPISAFGSGYRKAIKPDLIFNGGQTLYEKSEDTERNVTLKFVETNNPPGNQVATPSKTVGEINKTKYSCGTSNATALISRMAAQCHDSLLEISEDQASGIQLTPYMTPLLKAMIVHGCSWGQTSDKLEEILETQNNTNKKSLFNQISQWIGYGVPDNARVLACTEQRATLLGFGDLKHQQQHSFYLPLPLDLTILTKFRLTVTLAYFSPIAANTNRYRTAKLWFDIVNKDEHSLNKRDVDLTSSKQGTVQHLVFETKKIKPINEKKVITIQVNCKKDAEEIKKPIAYGLVVSLESTEGLPVSIYNEIRTRIAQPQLVPIRP